jgi:hypothetical protein
MAKLSPVYNWAEFINGIPANGAKVFTYAAGSSTKQNTYTDSGGGTPNPNPIVLDARGEPPNDIWLTEGQLYKFVFTASTDTDPPTSPIRTIDNISGVGDNSVTLDQWVDSGVTPTYVNATQFTVPGDQTSSFTVNRRIKATVTAGTVYGYISASVFGALTTVTVVLDSGTLDSGLSAVQLGLITPTNTSLPKIPLWVNSPMIADDAIIARTLADSALGLSMVNGIITASVAASALTIAIKTIAGTDPSATDPVHILFRNVTAGTGDYTVISLIAATSLVISSGSTLGTTSGVANKLWVVGFNDAGTFRLGAINLSTNAPFGDDVIASSTAEGGAGGADSAGVYYTGTAVTSKAMKVLGYVESTQATAGTWATSPSKVQLLTAGTKLHGDVVQQNVTYTGAVATGTTIMPFDDTIPQITEGTEFMTVSITPSSATSILLVEVTAFMACSISERIASAIFQDATANALGAGVTLCPSTNGSSEHVYSIRLQANTTSSITFRFRAGPASAATVTFNGSAGGRIFGGFMASNLRVTEIAS